MGERHSLGLLLRRHRHAAGLTQEELAERAQISAPTVSALERGVSQAPHPDTIERIAEALGLSPEDRAALNDARRRHLADPGEGAPTGERGATWAELPPTNLPRALTSFIGRSQEQAAIVSLVREAPLLTLTGAGGCGKTRLALQVAAELRASYPDGVWLVELAPLASPALVPLAVTTALGVYEEPGRPLLATLTAFVQPRHLLLVLDNCEHLVLACAELATALLRDCPQLHILATSREALRIAGERTWRVPSLSLPARHVPANLAWLAESEAVQLFVARAQAVRHTFSLTERNAAYVMQVCRRLDGIPLALELAAARLSVLTLEDLVARLDDRFGLLTGGSRTALPRQQTLRATLEWSYALLNEGEQTLLCRLAVFAGGWTLAAAETVCGDDPSPLAQHVQGVAAVTRERVMDRLAALVNKSLVTLEQQDDPTGLAGRYRLLETVRQYALEQLAARGEEAGVRQRHLDWCLGLAEASAHGQQEPERVAWRQQLERELDNLRAALRWAQAAGEVARGLRLAGALVHFWEWHSQYAEGLRWLKAFLDVASEADMSRWLHGAMQSREMATLLAWALTHAGQMAFIQTDPVAARTLAAQSLALFRELGEPTGIASALSGLGSVVRDEGDFRLSAALQEESADLWRGLGDRRGLGFALRTLAMTTLQMGNLERAAALLQESMALFHEMGDDLAIAVVHFIQGLVAWEQGDLAGARALGAQSLATARAHGNTRLIALDLGYLLGPVACESGDLATATALGEESLALGRELADGGVIGWACLGLGLATCEQGEPARAEAALTEGLALFWARGMQWFVACCLAALAGVAQPQGQAQRAARLAGATAALLGRLGAPLPRSKRALYHRAITAAATALGEEAFATAWAEGQAMPLAEAVALGLADHAAAE